MLESPLFHTGEHAGSISSVKSSNPGGGVGGDTALQKGTHEKVERSSVLLEEMWRNRRREMDRQMQGPAYL